MARVEGRALVQISVTGDCTPREAIYTVCP